MKEEDLVLARILMESKKNSQDKAVRPSASEQPKKFR